MKINIIIVGQLKNIQLYLRSIEVFTKMESVNEIIQVIWDKEAIQHGDLIEMARASGVNVIIQPEPKNLSSKVFYQMKALELGLDAVTDKSLPIFKTRADLYIQEEALIKITKLDRTFLNDQKLMEQKIWVPWFELTKPYYIADECFFSNYNDAVKLYNYDDSFDHLHPGDAGISHIRRFIGLDDMKSESVELVLKRFLITGHGTVKRRRILDFNLSCREFLEGIIAYYNFIETNFVVGLEGRYDEYIIFRKWSRPNRNLTGNIIDDFDIKKSFDRMSGAIMSHHDNNIPNYKKQISDLLIAGELIHDKSLKSYDLETYIHFRDELLKDTISDKLEYEFLKFLGYFHRIFSI